MPLHDAGSVRSPVGVLQWNGDHSRYRWSRETVPIVQHCSAMANPRSAEVIAFGVFNKLIEFGTQNEQTSSSSAVINQREL